LRLNPTGRKDSSVRKSRGPYSLRRRARASKASEDECEHTTDGLYCQKYARFHCPGLEKCNDIDDYLGSLPRGP